ncbi:Transposon TX1 uncharacterized 149 kDa protein [Vitis vinifera]|uniref:Transposon TX1 uncharacterized 149 kDa protein n=1 Tax=Vitis vinifera TaxID=29760 RepID=A0A438HHM3_VITVI|nr:Transposon TX1 uncharacterized 149 kDa protein [Vitis vinifera]
MLELPFIEGEVQAALIDMNGDKAPSPDGFTLLFWQSCWEFVKEEILEMFKEFYDQNVFLKSLNNTFLVLLPKKGGAEELGDFRPISLLRGLYKLLAKVLANRLKKVIGKVVFPYQNAFVTERQILDASLIVNEVIDAWNKRGENGLICKLDIEKAYDSINWQFLLKVMEKMGFGSKWLRWMWWCISTAKFSVMVNGAPAGFFSSSKGLHQGDPWCKIQRGRGRAVQVAHLLFADDTIVFGEVEEVDELAVELGCRVGKLPVVYLGLPLGVSNKAVSGGMGGLGIRKLTLVNKALIDKWIWRFACDKKGLWKQVLVAKYGQEDYGWRTKKVVGAFGVGVWKEILKEVGWC